MTRKVTGLPVTEKTVGPEWNGHQGNWDSNRVPITRIIIHTMDGTASSADARFNNPLSMVSAHYGILLTGEIWHWVNEDLVAYHAGNSGVNQCSIGIEHEDDGNYNGVRPDTLYNASASLVHDICKFYGLDIDRTHIQKHSEVSDRPTGCPDSLDIDKIVNWAQVGYGPTFDGQDVTVDNIHYKALGGVWNIMPNEPTPTSTATTTTDVPPVVVTTTSESPVQTSTQISQVPETPPTLVIPTGQPIPQVKSSFFLKDWLKILVSLIKTVLKG